MDIRPTDPPDTILLLEQLLKQVRDVTYSVRHVDDPIWRTANALACLLNILIDERRKAERLAPTSPVDWMWVYEHPREAAAEIERLRAALQEITDLCKREPATPFLADKMDRVAIAALSSGQ